MKQEGVKCHFSVNLWPTPNREKSNQAAAVDVCKQIKQRNNNQNSTVFYLVYF